MLPFLSPKSTFLSNTQIQKLLTITLFAHLITILFSIYYVLEQHVSAHEACYIGSDHSIRIRFSMLSLPLTNWVRKHLPNVLENISNVCSVLYVTNQFLALNPPSHPRKILNNLEQQPVIFHPPSHLIKLKSYIIPVPSGSNPIKTTHIHTP